MKVLFNLCIALIGLFWIGLDWSMVTTLEGNRVEGLQMQKLGGNKLTESKDFSELDSLNNKLRKLLKAIDTLDASKDLTKPCEELKKFVDNREPSLSVDDVTKILMKNGSNTANDGSYYWYLYEGDGEWQKLFGDKLKLEQLLKLSSKFRVSHDLGGHKYYYFYDADMDILAKIIKSQLQVYREPGQQALASKEQEFLINLGLAEDVYIGIICAEDVYIEQQQAVVYKSEVQKPNELIQKCKEGVLQALESANINLETKIIKENQGGMGNNCPTNRFFANGLCEIPDVNEINKIIGNPGLQFYYNVIYFTNFWKKGHYQEKFSSHKTLGQFFTKCYSHKARGKLDPVNLNQNTADSRLTDPAYSSLLFSFGYLKQLGMKNLLEEKLCI